METLRLRSADFRRERENLWIELEGLIAQVERKGLKSLDQESIRRLPSLYRAAVSSLSVARTISLDRNLLLYLESLVARSYVWVYGVKPQTGSMVRRFFTSSFPLAVRRFCGPLWVGAILLVLGTFGGWYLVGRDLSYYEMIIPEEVSQGRSVTSSTDELQEVLYSGKEKGQSELGLFAGFLFTHNAKIGLLCFALGFALGLPTLLLLLYNGLTLGALAGLYHSRGLSFEFWAWVLPHGITELMAVTLCGGAGLAVAYSLLAPGPHGRLHHLSQTGQQAILLVLGAVLLFFVAGLIEGFFRQMVQDLAVRYLTALSTLFLWIGYLWFWPRPQRSSTSSG